MAPRPRASFVASLGGWLVIATLVAAAGLSLRAYTEARQTVWLVNPTSRTAVVYLGEQRRTLLAGEVMAARAPDTPTFRVAVRLGETLETFTATRAADAQDVLIVDVAPEAAYVVVDLTPRYAAHGTVAARRRGADGRFRPTVVQVAKPGRLMWLRGGTAATIGPLEPLPDSVWSARKYGRTVYKLLRVPPDADVERLRAELARILAAKETVVSVEPPIKTRAGPPAQR